MFSSWKRGAQAPDFSSRTESLSTPLRVTPPGEVSPVLGGGGWGWDPQRCSDRKCAARVEDPGVARQMTESESLPWDFLALWSWVSPSAAPHLSLPISEMGG